MTVAGVALAHPVANHAVLPGAAADVADRETAEQCFGRLVEKKERHGLTGGEFLLVADDAAAKGAFRHFIGAPARFPRLESCGSRF